MPNTVFPERRGDNLTNKKFKQIGADNILASSPGMGSSCHTPTQRIRDLQSEGNGQLLYLACHQSVANLVVYLIYTDNFYFFA